jgi:hypothetical protein
MQVLPDGGMSPAHVEASLHEVERRSMRIRVSFIWVHQRLNLSGQELAQGCGVLGRKSLCFLHGLRAEAHGQVLFSHLNHSCWFFRAQQHIDDYSDRLTYRLALISSLRIRRSVSSNFGAVPSTC